MYDLSLSILDIAENSINAKANLVKIFILEDIPKDKLYISIVDDGKGMSEKEVSRVVDPFVTTRTCRRVGLGLPLLKTMAQVCHGDVTIDSEPGKGTTVKIVFQYGNIDRPPLGDITATVLCIISANPFLDVMYEHRVGDGIYKLDTRKVKKIVGESCFRKKEVLALISQDLKSGLDDLAKKRNAIFKETFGYLPKVDLV